MHVSPSRVSEPVLYDNFEPEAMKFEHVVAVVGYQTEGSLCSWFDGSLRCTHTGVDAAPPDDS